MKILTNVDMNQSEVQNVLIHPTAVEPANPKVGQMYTDISGDTPKLLWFNGKKWVPLGGAVVPEKYPTAVQPSVKITVSDIDASGMEVGTKVPISFSTKFNPGSYTYGPDTGITVESWYVYDTNEPPNVSTESSGTFAEVVVGDETDYKITVEAKHTAGAIPLTDQGSPYPAAQILAGTKSASTGSIAGFRKYFYGATVEYGELTSDRIRALTNSTEPVHAETNFDIKIPEGTNQIIIAFPSNTGLTLTSVIDTGAFNINVYDVFEKQVVDVEGANGYDAISYDVYVYTPDVSLGANTYKVTIS